MGKENVVTASRLQNSIKKFKNWTKKWKNKPNEDESRNIDFIDRHIEHIQIIMNKHKLPSTDSAFFFLFLFNYIL